MESRTQLEAICYKQIVALSWMCNDACAVGGDCDSRVLK